MSAAEKLAEKIRLQKIQEQDSLRLAKGLFGKVPRKGMLLSTGVGIRIGQG